MQRVEMVALRPLQGDYGTRGVGEIFSTDTRTAEKLEAKGLACRHYRRPERKAVHVYENKMIEPAANKTVSVVAPKPHRKSR
jgi:hypothetical protein